MLMPSPSHQNLPVFEALRISKVELSRGRFVMPTIDEIVLLVIIKEMFQRSHDELGEYCVEELEI